MGRKESNQTNQVLVNRLVELAQEKVWLGELEPDMTIDWDVKHQTKHTCTATTEYLVFMFPYFGCELGSGNGSIG